MNSLKLLESGLSIWNPAGMQIESFNYFIDFAIPQVIEQRSSIETSYGYKYIWTNPRVPKPTYNDQPLTPKMARQLGIHYDTQVLIDIQTYIKNEQGEYEFKVTHTNVPLFRLPIMLGSSACYTYNCSPAELIAMGECVHDVGGVFIINGNERVIIAQERMVYNKPTVYSTDNGMAMEIRSMSYETAHSVRTRIDIKDHVLMIELALFQPKKIPLMTIFKILGMEEHHMEFFLNDWAKKYPMYHHAMRSIILASYDNYPDTIADAVAQIIPLLALNFKKKTNKVGYITHSIRTDLFPHLGIDISHTRVIHQLFLCVEMFLLTCIDPARNSQQREHICNKRFEHSSMLIHYLYNSLYKRFVNRIIQRLSQNIDIVQLVKDEDLISRGLRNCFSTGKWGIPRGFIRSGVCQLINRVGYPSYISPLCRVMYPVNKDQKNKNVSIREIHPSHAMFICPTDTPEGHNVGIIKNFSVMIRPTFHTPLIYVKNTLWTEFGKCADMEWYSLQSHDPPRYQTRILVNGEWIGSCADAVNMVTALRHLRDTRVLHESVSIVYQSLDYQIHIYCDEGRLMRPLLVVNQETQQLYGIELNLPMDWNQWVEHGALVYRDYHELLDDADCLVQARAEVIGKHKDLKFTYAEIHPSLMLSICSACIPFPERNPGPRNTFENSMMRQSLGLPSCNYLDRCETQTHILSYPQQPLISTVQDRALGIADMGYGTNVIVAIGSNGGYNQEDAVIINKAAVDRGLFHTQSIRTLTFSEQKIDDTECSEYFEIPPEPLRNPRIDWSKLDEYGIIRLNSRVQLNDPLIARTRYKRNVPIKDTTICVSNKDCSLAEGTVVRIQVISLKLRTIHITIASSKMPDVGDKYASRSAQKGTCGILYAPEDMPFTSDGMIPDLICNELAFVSRMTVGVLLEMLVGKAMCFEWNEYDRDATAFEHTQNNYIDKFGSILTTHGFECMGNETFYDGRTGLQLRAKMFMGPSYYQKLKHMVVDKIHSRSHGAIQLLTRQPLEGRTREGGLRIGEMERDCMLTHGDSQFLRERFSDMSDAFTVHICSLCHTPSGKSDSCVHCKKNVIHRVSLPYVFKLMMQELDGMMLKTEYLT